MPQVPKGAWQPVPQWSVLLPHQPYWLQQVAPGSLMQVVPPCVAPQRPLVLGGGVPEGVVAELARVEELARVDDDAGRDEELERTLEVETRGVETAQLP